MNNFHSDDHYNGDHTFLTEDNQSTHSDVNQASHASHVSVPGSSCNAASSSSASAPQIQGFTPDQFQKLLNLIQGNDSQSVNSTQINQLRIHENPHNVNQFNVQHKSHENSHVTGKGRTIILSSYSTSAKTCSSWI